MEFLKKLFGGRKLSKEDLIRNLTKKRVKSDLNFESMGYNKDMVESLGEAELSGLPEATVVTIIETYALSQQSGAPEELILNHIENHRSQIGSGTLPNPLNLESYIKYRIEIEHTHGVPISEELISEAIEICREHYNC